jgi:hypothetical protein
MIYRCGFCNREYKRKTYYTKHMNICEYLYKNKRERDILNEEIDDTPDIRTMYEIILELTNKNKLLEEKVDKLTKFINYKNNNLNYIDILKNNYSNIITFYDFINSINIDNQQIDIIFKNNIIDGITKIFKIILSDNNIPIKSFKQNPNILFVFNDKWCIMNNDLITILLSNTFKKLLNIIIEWQNNNDISNNDYLSELYITNLNKIMSFDYNNKNNINIIKKKIYEIVSG